MSKRTIIVGGAALAAVFAGWMATRAEAAGESTPPFPAPRSSEGVSNRLGCKLVGNDGMETAVGFWPCVQAWVYADFGALKSGRATQVPALVVAQMKSSQLSDHMGRILFDNWSVERIERDGEDYITIHGWGFKKNGYQMKMENFVPFKHGEHTTTFVTTTPDGSQSTNYTMQCYFDLDGVQ
ncbi:hypothetical protein L6R52_11080 [Myxococcota bacterium]|nr:hypothetical protein [Myxococcota bacterium]